MFIFQSKNKKFVNTLHFHKVLNLSRWAFYYHTRLPPLLLPILQISLQVVLSYYLFNYFGNHSWPQFFYTDCSLSSYSTKRQVLRMFYFSLNTFSLSAVIKHGLTHDWWMTCLALLTWWTHLNLFSCSLIFIFLFLRRHSACGEMDGFTFSNFSWLLFWLVGSECCVVGQVMLVMSSHLVLWHSCDAFTW